MELPLLPEHFDAPLGRVDVVVRHFDGPDHGDYGQWLESARTIELNESMSEQQQWIALFHEQTHVALSDSGVDEVLTEEMVEAICDAIATARFREQFFTSTPK